MAIYNIIAGTTKPVRFQLLEAGVPIDLTSALSVSLLLSDRSGVVVANPGTVAVIDAINGKVQLTPINGVIFDPTLSPYNARWKIVDSGNGVSYCPNGSRDTWNIVAA